MLVSWRRLPDQVGLAADCPRPLQLSRCKDSVLLFRFTALRDEFFSAGAPCDLPTGAGSCFLFWPVFRIRRNDNGIVFCIFNSAGHPHLKMGLNLARLSARPSHPPGRRQRRTPPDGKMCLETRSSNRGPENGHASSRNNVFGSEAFGRPVFWSSM